MSTKPCKTCGSTERYLVTYHVNTALSCFGEDKLIELAEQIVKYQRSIN